MNILAYFHDVSDARKVIATVLALAMLIALSSPLHAQSCPPAWLPGSGYQGTSGLVYGMQKLRSGRVLVFGDFKHAGLVKSPAFVLFDPNLQTWLPVSSAITGSGRAAVELANGDLVLAGVGFLPNNVSAGRIARFRPSTGQWFRLGQSTFGVSGGDVAAVIDATDTDLLMGGAFTSAGGTSANRIVRYNLTTNTFHPFGSGANGQVNVFLKLPGGDILVGGDFTTINGINYSGLVRYRPTDNSWLAVPRPMPTYSIAAMSNLPDGRVAISAVFDPPTLPAGGGIALFDPAQGTWTQPAFLSVTPRAIEPLPNGELLLGGFFQNAGNTGANYIVRFNPQTMAFLAVADQINGGVYSIMALGADQILVVGGFTSIDGTTLTRVALLDLPRADWSPLGSGIDVPIGEFRLHPSGDVITAGRAKLIAGIPVNYIARYTPSTNVWRPMGSPPLQYAESVAVMDNGDIFVIGPLTGSTQTRTKNILRYHETTDSWLIAGSPITTGVDDLLFGIVPHTAERLLAIGQFLNVPGQSPTPCAVFDPATGTWESLGQGLNGSAFAAAHAPNGDVFVSGLLSVDQSSQAYRVVRWDRATQTWSNIGGVFDRFVTDLQLSDRLYAAGDFFNVAGTIASGVAVWDPVLQIWQPMSAGVGASALAPRLVTLDGARDGFIVSGQFVSAGGVPASNLAGYSLSNSSFYAFGTGANDTTRGSLELPSGDMLVRGEFSAVNGVTGAGLARLSRATSPPTILVQPPDTLRVRVGDTATIAVRPAGDRVHGFLWKRDNQNLDVHANASVVTGELTIPRATLADVGAYQVTITNACGQIVSTACRLEVCAADFDNSGIVDPADIFAFLNAWFLQQRTADVDGQNRVDVQDIFAFLNGWLAGC